MHVRWDKGAAATPHGQLVFFAEFLAATSVFERWVSSCPLAYRSGNAPDKRDVLGTLMLGLLAGHRRYSHITALRGDLVAAQALGMNKIVSEDALRRRWSAWTKPPAPHGCARHLSTRCERHWTSPGCWTSTPPSSRYTVDRKAPNWATTRLNPVAPAMRCTPFGWQPAPGARCAGQLRQAAQ